MNIVLIGAGNLATNLGKALKKAGQTIAQVYSHTVASAEQLASILGCSATNDLQQLAEAEVYIISIKDAALQSVVSTVCKQHPNAIFLHTAGSMPMDIFKDEAQHYGVLYPMQTFSKAREVDFRIIPTFIEWNDERSHHTICSLAESVSNRIYPLSSEDRKYLHLSAVWACNFANHCYDVASELLKAHHLPFDVMLPLIDETARKVHELSPREAQTGPAVRYDENVIHAQAEMLKGNHNLQELYLQLSKSIHDLSKQR
jgi:predicted short-subunit dehydrogenase-like oxidoreductase (DUF2520 family)